MSLQFDSPPVALVLDTDQGKLSQILRNLVSNALKFTERGEVRVSLASAEEMAVFQVRDTGIGIAPEHFDRIFEEFYTLRIPLSHPEVGELERLQRQPLDPTRAPVLPADCSRACGPRPWCSTSCWRARAAGSPWRI